MSDKEQLVIRIVGKFPDGTKEVREIEIDPRLSLEDENKMIRKILKDLDRTGKTYQVWME